MNSFYLFLPFFLSCWHGHGQSGAVLPLRNSTLAMRKRPPIGKETVSAKTAALGNWGDWGASLKMDRVTSILFIKCFFV